MKLRILATLLVLVLAGEASAQTREQVVRIPAVYSIVRDAPSPVLLVEVPFYPPDAMFENGEYVLNATAHWRPVMNGYSGYTPDSYRARVDRLWLFPAEFALQAIHDEGATHVMVHLERFGTDAAAIERVMAARPDFKLLATDGAGHRLYEVRR